MLASRANEIPLAHLLEEIGVGIIDSQMALDLSGITTGELLSDIELPGKSVVIAVVETVDQEGHVTAIQPLFNERPMSLAEFGLSPVFLQIAEADVSLGFVAYLREPPRRVTPQAEHFHKRGIDPDAPYIDFGRETWTQRCLSLFGRAANMPIAPSQDKVSRNFRLTVSSATSVAVSSKVDGAWGVWRIRVTIRPKDPPGTEISAVT